MNVNIFIFSVCSRSYITSFGLFCKYAVLANMSRGDWLIYTTIVKQSTWIMCNILPSLRCIAVRFLPFPLHVPDSRYAHKQNADERQTHIEIRSGAKCPTHRQGRPATSFSVCAGARCSLQVSCDGVLLCRFSAFSLAKGALKVHQAGLKS